MMDSYIIYKMNEAFLKKNSIIDEFFRLRGCPRGYKDLRSFLIELYYIIINISDNIIFDIVFNNFIEVVVFQVSIWDKIIIK